MTLQPTRRVALGSIASTAAAVMVFVTGLAGLGATVAAQTTANTVDVQQSCLAGRGRVDVDVAVGDDGSARDVSVTVGPLAPRTRTVDPGGSTRITVTGRPDGPLDVTTSVDGVVVDDQTVTVGCAPVLAEPVVETSCLAARGRVDVYVPRDDDYTVSFPGLGDRIIDAGTTGRVTWTGRPDGTYTITVTSSDTTYRLEATIACGRKGFPGTGLVSRPSCTALADDLRSRALSAMAPMDLELFYYGSRSVSMAVDAFDMALAENRPNEADLAAFTPDRTYFAGLGATSNPPDHPNSVAVLAVDNGVIIVDQRSNDFVLTRYDAAGETVTATLRVEGFYVRARLVDGVVQLVTQTPPNLAGTDASSIEATKTAHWLPLYTWTAPDGTTDSQILTRCAETYIPEAFAGFSVVSLTSLDAGTLEPTPGVGVVADESMVLVDDAQAVIATEPWDPQRTSEMIHHGQPLDEAYVTSIHDFDLSAPDRATYRASGRVRGAVNALDRLDDGRLVASTCEGVSWWINSAGAPCVISTLETVRDKVRVTGASGRLGLATDVGDVRFGGDFAVVEKRDRAAMVVGLTEPGSFPTGDLNGTSFRWTAFALGEDRLLVIDGNQMRLLDISEVSNPVQLASYGAPDPGYDADELYWLRTSFDAGFSWDPTRGYFFIPVLVTSVNDPYHIGGYTTESGAWFTISDEAIDYVRNIGGSRTFEADLDWRSLIDGDEVRIAIPGSREIRMSLREPS